MKLIRRSLRHLNLCPKGSGPLAHATLPSTKLEAFDMLISREERTDVFLTRGSLCHVEKVAIVRGHMVCLRKVENLEVRT